MKKRVFISYRRDCGQELAAIAYEALKSSCTVYWDVEHHEAGNFVSHIEQNLASADVVVPIFTSETFRKPGGEYFFKEINFAVQNNKVILPFVSSDFSFEDIPDEYNLREYNGVKYNGEYSAASVEKLRNMCVGEYKEEDYYAPVKSYFPFTFLIGSPLAFLLFLFFCALFYTCVFMPYYYLTHSYGLSAIGYILIFTAIIFAVEFFRYSKAIYNIGNPELSDETFKSFAAILVWLIYSAPVALYIFVQEKKRYSLQKLDYYGTLVFTSLIIAFLAYSLICSSIGKQIKIHRLAINGGKGAVWLLLYIILHNVLAYIFYKNYRKRKESGY